MSDQFERTQQSPLASSVTLIEQLLKEWNIVPADIKSPDKNLWYLVQGSANFQIELFKYNKGGTVGEVDCVEVGGIIMKLPKDNLLPLYKKLLVLNSSGVGCYFAIRGELVMLLATRELAGLDFQELKTMVNEVRIYSDYWDDILMMDFGGTK